ncbi:sulfatase family protein [Flammeovirga kamogawensis]|uniref:Arylsulfatase n=1 Tax=Flammeovirga kamogawensis TaxID=373891 RepID=A0ABX8H3I9_9BACT|nr:arylsulfatase [Flammeovirga kamogawensis]MBB6460433.1 arylsulfatase A [Flammeovirga kamogawensis]QWG10238.1 arylsulfatase [Flammeovirga kamogawensis]TRX64687.1 arylsulfatase [Flammeovirga kamogawensis]
MKLLIAVLSVLLYCNITFAQSKKPNIILFFADDFGYGSTNIYGASKDLIQTPHINQLAEEGIHFTNAFTTGSVCSPTRYGLLTGEYSWRTSLQKGVVNTKDACLIDRNTKTLPSYLQGLGYNTAAIGKWHLGYKNERFKNLLGTIENGPNDHGFDYNFTVPNNLDDIHKIYIENNKIYGLRSDKIAAYGGSFYGNQYVGYDAPQRVTEQVMNDLTNKSIEWLSSIDKNEPFFLYFSSVAVHHPITPSPEMRGKSNAGAYGDFIQDIDRCLGVLIDYLEKNGLRENTMIIFASDNGGDIPNKKKVMPENFAINKGLKINGDYKGDKHTIWEGGFRIPMIINHPNNIKKGMQSDAIVSTVDFYAFIGEYLNNGKEIDKNYAIDSHSFYKVIKQPNKKYTRAPLIHRDVKGRKAVRDGHWKFIEAKNTASKNENLHAQLFNLEEDFKEENNIIDKHPKKAAELKAYLTAAKEEGTRLFIYK